MRTPAAAAPYAMTCSSDATPQDFDPRRHAAATAPPPLPEARVFDFGASPQFYAGYKPRDTAAADRRATTQTLIVAFFVLLCLFSCAMTVALLYQSHAETHRQVEEVISDLKAFTDVVRDELVAKRAIVDDYKQQQQQQQTRLKQQQRPPTSYGDDDATDVDYEELQLRAGYADDDRFMGVDLDGNRWPSGGRRRPVADGGGGGGGVEANVGTTAETDSGTDGAQRRRRSAAIDVTKTEKNDLNSSANEKSNVEFIEKEIGDEGNKVPMQNLPRKGKKVEPVLYKTQEQEIDDVEKTYEDSKNKQLAAAAHFSSNSSKYNSRTHAHYQGNGKIKHPDGEYRDWSQHVWNGHSNANHFQFKNGIVEISTPGVYFVYAQIYYSDQHDVNGYFVMKNDEKILGCTTTRHQGFQSDSCYTAGLIYFNANDILSIKGLDMERYIILDPVRSFFGLFEVAKHFK